MAGVEREEVGGSSHAAMASGRLEGASGWNVAAGSSSPRKPDALAKLSVARAPQIPRPATLRPRREGPRPQG